MPPKKDAFADLFQSANSSNSVNNKLNKLSLSERQKLQQKQQQQQTQSQQLPKQFGSLNSSWSNLDILSTQNSSNSSQIPSRVSTPKAQAQGLNSININSINNDYNNNNHSINSTSTNIDEDPFAIFNKPEPKVESNQSQLKTSNKNGNQQNQSSNHISLLDDDDFIDVYPEQKQQPQQQQPKQQLQPPSKPTRPDVIRNNSNTSNNSINSNRSNRSKSTNTTTTKSDQIIAELIDIGFTIEESNEAVNSVGSNLQDCVNYIMNKNSNSSSSSPTRSSSRTTTRNGNNNDTTTTYYEEDDSILGIKPEKLNFNEISNDLLKKANSFYNFSKKKVIENLENFNTGSSGSNDNLPQWMKNQNKYKSKTTEKNGDEIDYGDDDDDNINQEEIAKYMRLQKEKERQRLKERNEEKDYLPSRPQRPTSRTEVSDFLPSRPQKPNSRTSSPINPPPKPQRPSSSSRSNSNNGGISHSTQQNNNTTIASKPSSKPPVEVEVDLLGLSSPSSSNPTTSSHSSLRDSTPLNQIIESEYITNKTKATELFKNGDYIESLELYKKCLLALPPKHEFKVIILSNLSLINKNLGHLKESLNNCEEALELISIDECNNHEIKIDGKSINYWFVKILSIKAESLELIEKFKQSLDVYNLLISKFNKNDKKIMDGRRRVDKIINPENYKPKPAPKSTPKQLNKPVKPTISSTSKPKQQEEKELDTLVKDEIINKIKNWQSLKNNDIRKMLINLGEILPSNLPNKNLLNLSTNDVILTKQIKLNYLKIINMIHPDKTYGLFKNDSKSKFLCNEIFIILNERWELFKKEENL
ncbi:SWA2 [Candida pseudojiufengensis]|uniref:SWA2 n=1 Tax=Candida pseudojiufengensis TaxID=497109 RepID=UPI002224A638|nr:SWA2 [Candida pseudojiufengensis]KAI5962681.1 SWA2 [Candida pseudojiufengensis]